MNNITKRILYGFSDIYICGYNKIPIPIYGAKSINIDIQQDYKYLNSNGSKNIRLNGEISGKGKLTVLGLTEDEQALIFGYQKSNKGGVFVGLNNTTTKLRLLFSREKRNGYKILYCVYCCMFNPSSIVANTFINQNGIEEDVLEIDFDVLVDKDSKLVYYAIDTETGDKYTCDNWFQTIQYP